jgi:hypothetical protein
MLGQSSAVSAGMIKTGRKCMAIGAGFFHGAGRWLRQPAYTAIGLLCACGALAQDGASRGSGYVAVELGPVAFARNDVRIPGDVGSPFDMRDIIGGGAEPFFRINGEWQVNGRHNVGFEIAPLEVTGTGSLPAETIFADSVFAAGPVVGEYQFNVYKVSYRYRLEQRGNWQWKIGVTGLVRDASVALRQGALYARDENVGFVPLLHADATRRLGRSWRLAFDFDGLAGGPGRAFDLSLKAIYDVGEKWRIGAGYRLLEGGVDTDDVYNFAWANYLLLDLGYRF